MGVLYSYKHLAIDWLDLLDMDLEDLDAIAVCLHGEARSMDFMIKARELGLKVIAVRGGLLRYERLGNMLMDEICTAIANQKVIICVGDDDDERIAFEPAIRNLERTTFLLKVQSSDISEQIRESFPRLSF